MEMAVVQCSEAMKIGGDREKGWPTCMVQERKGSGEGGWMWLWCVADPSPAPAAVTGTHITSALAGYQPKNHESPKFG